MGNTVDSLRKVQAMREDKYTLALKKSSSETGRSESPDLFKPVLLKKQVKWKTVFVLCLSLICIVNLIGFLAFKTYASRETKKKSEIVKSNVKLPQKSAKKKKKQSSLSTRRSPGKL